MFLVSDLRVLVKVVANRDDPPDDARQIRKSVGMGIVHVRALVSGTLPTGRAKGKLEKNAPADAQRYCVWIRPPLSWKAWTSSSTNSTTMRPWNSRQVVLSSRPTMAATRCLSRVRPRMP